MKTCVILGTRPEIIKFSPLIREYQKNRLDYFILHTGQHYNYSLDRIFFEQLQLPSARYNLCVGSGCHGEQTGQMLSKIEALLQKEMPDIVLVEGDTNTALAGALAAAKLKIKVGHVEAGLRSHDRWMPEEINRVLVDHCSDYLFAPTENSRQNLLSEGLAQENVATVGNTIVDAVTENLAITQAKSSVLGQLNLREGHFIVATAHRQENVDFKPRFTGIIRGLQLVQRHFDLPLIYPIHPRSRRQLEQFGIDTDGLTLTDPLSYPAFLQLEQNARLVLSDSGGVQEETCVLHVPCVTLRDSTERPETVAVGANQLAGTDPQNILGAAKAMTQKERNWTNPFGDGTTAQKIVTFLRERLSDGA